MEKVRKQISFAVMLFQKDDYMKRIYKIVMVMLLMLSLYSCETIKSQISKITNGASNFSDNMKEKNYEKNKDTENWEIVELDTAIEEEYLSFVEKNVILELNKVRTNPAKYAELYIEPMLKRFSGKEYRTGGAIYLTSEGKNAVNECLKVLSKAKPRPLLYPNVSLFKLAKDHVDKQGPSGQTGHDGPNGESFNRRIERLMDKHGYTGENISYGYNIAREIVKQLLVDDGVPSRGHRKNILDLKYDEVGVSIGRHSEYQSMCVIDFGNY